MHADRKKRARRERATPRSTDGAERRGPRSTGIGKALEVATRDLPEASGHRPAPRGRGARPNGAWTRWPWRRAGRLRQRRAGPRSARASITTGSPCMRPPGGRRASRAVQRGRPGRRWPTSCPRRRGAPPAARCEARGLLALPGWPARVVAAGYRPTPRAATARSGQPRPLATSWLPKPEWPVATQWPLATPARGGHGRARGDLLAAAPRSRGQHGRAAHRAGDRARPRPIRCVTVSARDGSRPSRAKSSPRRVRSSGRAARAGVERQLNVSEMRQIRCQ